MRTKKRSAGSAPAGSSPFGTQSRLVHCPICGRSVHRLLATAHVESHFIESGQPEDEGPAAAVEGAVRTDGEAFEDTDPQVGAGAGGKDELQRCAGGSAQDEAEEGDEEDVAFGGPVGEPVADSTPGSERLWRAFKLQVMSGDSDSCGLCYERFELGTRDRFCLWPCQHTRQCGPCALRLWQTPKAKRRCPWCAVKLDTRPRAFRPFM